MEPKKISVEFWGDFACFTPPHAKVERYSYQAPTPPAAIGMLSAIYRKKSEFTWEIDEIAILNPIQYISIQRNEVKVKANRSLKPIDTTEVRTQRQTVALKDVRYRITAHIVPRPEYEDKIDQLYKQAERRINCGQCFYQPNLGMSEFPAFFEMSDGTREPCKEASFDMGIVVHDMWDVSKWKDVDYPLERTLFHCVAKEGVIKVPSRDDPSIIRVEREG